MRFLQRHPFPVIAHLERVVAVSFAFPEEVLRPLVGDDLEIDAYDGHGFLTIALVWTSELRPQGFPRMLGQDFFLAGYRIFTKFSTPERRLRGLKILRSETDKRRMLWLGNLMTGYKYRHVCASSTTTGHETRIVTTRNDGTTTLDLTFDDCETTELPAGSPFPDWRTARRFAGPMPHTFSPVRGGMLVVEGRRGHWNPRPVVVRNCDAAIFTEPPFAGLPIVVANAFATENVPYHWSAGRMIPTISRHE